MANKKQKQYTIAQLTQIGFQATPERIEKARTLNTFMFCPIDSHEYYYWELNGEIFYAKQSKCRNVFGDSFLSCFECEPLFSLTENRDDKVLMGYYAKLNNYAIIANPTCAKLQDEDQNTYVNCHRGKDTYKCYYDDDILQAIEKGKTFKQDMVEYLDSNLPLPF